MASRQSDSGMHRFTEVSDNQEAEKGVNTFTIIKISFAVIFFKFAFYFYVILRFLRHCNCPRA